MDIRNTHFLRCLEALKDAPFFKTMDTDKLKTLLLLMTKSTWAEDTFKSGSEIGMHIHLIVSGRLRVYQINPNSGREHTVAILTKGDIFDIMSLMDTDAHDIYYEAIDELEVLFLPVANMHRWISENPEMNYSIFKYLGKRMRQLENAATDICLNSTLVRLSKLLVSNVNDTSHELEVIHNLPNNQIASLIGTTRAVVNRHIQELKNYGAITVSRKNIHVENMAVLQSIARETFAA